MTQFIPKKYQQDPFSITAFEARSRITATPVKHWVEVLDAALVPSRV